MGCWVVCFGGFFHQQSSAPWTTAFWKAGAVRADGRGWLEEENRPKYSSVCKSNRHPPITKLHSTAHSASFFSVFVSIPAILAVDLGGGLLLYFADHCSSHFLFRWNCFFTLLITVHSTLSFPSRPLTARSTSRTGNIVPTSNAQKRRNKSTRVQSFPTAKQKQYFLLLLAYKSIK